MRKYYSDYIRHCTRFYFYIEKSPSEIKDKVSYNNYVAVSNILSDYPTATVNMLRTLYLADSMVQAVNEYSDLTKMPTQQIWHTVQNYEKQVAIERGLVNE